MRRKLILLRTSAVFLSLILSLPNPAFALRAPEKAEAKDGLEELHLALLDSNDPLRTTANVLTRQMSTAVGISPPAPLPVTANAGLEENRLDRRIDRAEQLLQDGQSKEAVLVVLGTLEYMVLEDLPFTHWTQTAEILERANPQLPAEQLPNLKFLIGRLKHFGGLISASIERGSQFVPEDMRVARRNLSGILEAYRFFYEGQLPSQFFRQYWYGDFHPPAGSTPAGMEEVDEAAFRQMVETGSTQEALGAQGYAVLDARQAASLGVKAIGGFIVADSVNVTDAGHFIVAESGLVNAAAASLFPWVFSEEGLNSVIDSAKGAEAQAGDLMLLKPAQGISAESIIAVLRERGFTENNAPRVAVGDAGKISALSPLAFQLLAAQKGLPAVVFLNVAMRLKDAAGNTYTLLLMA